MSLLVKKVKEFKEIQGFQVASCYFGGDIIFAKFDVGDIEQIDRPDLISDFCKKTLDYSNSIGVQVFTQKKRVKKEYLSPFKFKRETPKVFSTDCTVAVSCHSKQVVDLAYLLEESGGEPFAKDEIEEFFRIKNERTIYYSPNYIFDGNSYYKYYYVTKQNSLLDVTIANLMERFDFDFEITVNMNSISKIESERLTSNAKKEAIANSSETTYDDLESLDLISKGVTRRADSHVKVEWILAIKSPSLEFLETRTTSVEMALKSIGEVHLEYIRAKRPYISTRFGAYPDIFFYENLSQIDYILPTKVFGNTTVRPKESELSLLRRDGSIYQYNRFSKKFKAANSLVLGSTGSGKGVFVNSEISSLSRQDNTEIIIADIGSTYLNLTESLGGNVINYSENTSFGIDPFHYLSDRETYKNYLHTISRFVKDLISENSEKLNTEENYDIELAIKEYAESNINSYSFHHFTELYSLRIPRGKALKRWGVGGIYESIITQSNFKQSKVSYFNLQNVMSSSNKEVSKVCFSLLMCFYAIKIIQQGDRGTRIVLILDEVKELLEPCKEMIIMVHANARKLGHAIMIIDQSSLKLSSVSKELLRNSDIHVLFDLAGTREEIKEWHRMTDQEFERFNERMNLEENRHSFFLKTYNSMIEGKILLDKESYWRLNTNKDDRDRLAKVMELMPTVPKEKVIECLSFS